MSLEDLDQQLNIAEIQEKANSDKNYAAIENPPAGTYIAYLNKVTFEVDANNRNYLKKYFTITDSPDNPEKWHGRNVISFENISVENSKDGNVTAISILMRNLNKLIPSFWKADDRGAFVLEKGFKFNKASDLPMQHEAIVKKYGIASETPALYEIKVTPSGEKNINVEVVNGYLA
jgi:hypothetical protein